MTHKFENCRGVEVDLKNRNVLFISLIVPFHFGENNWRGIKISLAGNQLGNVTRLGIHIFVFIEDCLTPNPWLREVLVFNVAQETNSNVAFVAFFEGKGCQRVSEDSITTIRKAVGTLIPGDFVSHDLLELHCLPGIAHRDGRVGEWQVPRDAGLGQVEDFGQQRLGVQHRAFQQAVRLRISFVEFQHVRLVRKQAVTAQRGDFTQIRSGIDVRGRQGNHVDVA